MLALVACLIEDFTLFRGHEVDFRLAISPEKIRQTIATVKPDFTICPFLQQKIPDDVCQSHMCMVFHPGTILKV